MPALFTLATKISAPPGYKSTFDHLRSLSAAQTAVLSHKSVVQAPIGTLTEGDILTAEVDGTHLYHGAVIDLGTQYHGVIPVMEEQWPFVLDLLELGAKVKVRVHKACSSFACGRQTIKASLRYTMPCSIEDAF